MITDLEKIKEIIIELAQTMPYEIDGPFVNHILIDTPVRMIDGKMVMLDYDNFHIAIDEVCEHIKKIDNINTLLFMIRKPDRLQLLDMVRKFMSEEDYSRLLPDIWITTEFPHQMEVSTLVGLFTSTKKEWMMDEEELKVFSNLPDEIKIYRGCQDSKSVIKGLSWTIDLEKAKWFSNRWKKDGKVYEATINKEDVFAYFDDEKEIVARPQKLKDVKEVTI